MTVKLSPIFCDAQLDSSGNPASGYQLFTYTAGSSTKQTVYKDSAGLTQHTNPILLNSRGEPSAPIWLTSGGAYKFIFTSSTDTDPPVSPIRTVDNVEGVNDTTTSIDEWKASGLTPTFVSATSFTLSGDQTTAFHIGRRLKTTNTAGTVYSTITLSSFSVTTTVTVVNDSGVLDSGLSSVSFGLLSANNPSLPLGTQFVNKDCLGRLTLTTATPVTTADVTAATTLYFTPYKGNTCAVHDGTKWTDLKFSELSIAVPATTATMYDVFFLNSSGVAALEVLAWTNDTTRATALALQDGIYVKTGSSARRYIGSFRTTGVSGQTEDSLAKRYVWNYYNRVPRPMQVLESTDTWTYTTATLRQANGAAANQLDYVQGVSEEPVEAMVSAAALNNGAVGSCAFSIGVGVDSTSANSAQLTPITTNLASSVAQQLIAQYRGYPGVGRHFLAWLEFSTAAGTTTWAGDNGAPPRQQSGIIGRIMA